MIMVSGLSGNILGVYKRAIGAKAPVKTLPAGR